MITLRSYVSGAWVVGRGKPAVLVNPSTEEPLAEAGSEGVDFGAAARFARDRGGAALRALTFAQRGAAIGKLGKLIFAHRDALIDLAIANGGCTRGDAKFDIDGGSGTLAAYAAIGQALGDRRVLADGELTQLSRSPRFAGQHILTPREGVAVHVNAFNFPAWGFAEKAAVALLAGMPVIVKPAASTALLAHRIMELLVDAALFPEGAVSFIAGSVGDLVDHLGPQDVLAFTGSGETGAALRCHPCVVRCNVRVNVEADSLNAAVLGKDVERGSDTYRLFINDVVRDMTQKTGQKCTAIRRVLAPRDLLAAVEEDLGIALDAVVVGNPAAAEVTMGPLATAAQRKDVRSGIDQLTAAARVVWRAPVHTAPVAAPAGKGFFQAPVLFRAEERAGIAAVHAREVFGPVATVISYDGTAASAIALVRQGEGGLVSSLYTNDRAFTEETLLGLAPHHGRVFIAGDAVVEHATQPGMVLPLLVHGGPGRAGGGEELGGRRGLAFYMQRTAVQASRTFLETWLGS